MEPIQTLTAQPDTDKLHRYQETRRVTIVGALVNTLLAAAQIFGGLVTHSQGLIADGLHTLADLTSDFVVLIAAKHAHAAADEEHPYGHGRIETLATSLLGISLLAVAAGIAIDVIGRLLSPAQLLKPTPAALAFALLAVLSKEGLYRYTVSIARKINSSLLEANAWHHRSDAISSLLVIIGITGSLAGIPAFDAFAALAVAGFIALIGWKLLWQSGQELIDASLDDATLDKIENVIRSVDGVVNMHMLRTRKSGSDAFADVHIQVPSKISVSEGHQIAEAVRAALQREIDEISDVTVHIDPEDDLSASQNAPLPLRDELLGRLRKAWLGLEIAEAVENIVIHYLNGQIELEIYLPKKYADHPEVNDLRSAALAQPYIHHVSIHYSDTS